jgi:hypothetical protein
MLNAMRVASVSADTVLGAYDTLYDWNEAYYQSRRGQLPGLFADYLGIVYQPVPPALSYERARLLVESDESLYIVQALQGQWELEDTYTEAQFPGPLQAPPGGITPPGWFGGAERFPRQGPGVGTQYPLGGVNPVAPTPQSGTSGPQSRRSVPAEKSGEPIRLAAADPAFRLGQLPDDYYYDTAGGEPEETRRWVGELEDHEAYLFMEGVREQAAVLELVGTLGLTPAQRQAVAPLVQGAAVAGERYRQAYNVEAARLGTQLAQMRNELWETGAVSNVVAALWADSWGRSESMQQEAEGSMVSALDQMQGALDLGQFNAITWPVGAGGYAGRHQHLNNLLQVAGAMAEGYDFLWQKRFTIFGSTPRYGTYNPEAPRAFMQPSRWPEEAGEFVSRFLPPGTPGAEQAVGVVVRTLGEVRALNREEWPSRWGAIVTNMMIDMGAVPIPEQLGAQGGPVAWEALVEILSAGMAPVAMAG